MDGSQPLKLCPQAMRLPDSSFSDGLAVTGALAKKDPWDRPVKKALSELEKFVDNVETGR